MTSLHKLIRICGVLLALLLVAPILPTSGMAQAHRQRPLPLASHLRPDGTLDTDGVRGALDPSGHTLAFGTNGEPRFVPAAADLGNEGWDDRFGPPGIVDGSVVATAVSATGDLYVAGSFLNDKSSIPTNHIARWDGRRWHTLGEGVSGDLQRVRRLATHGPNVYAVGMFTHAGGVVARQVARWDGTRWHALGSGVGPQLKDEFGTSDGKIYAVAVAPDGDVYVGGNFNQIDDVPANGVARWDGAEWHALGEGITDRGAIPGEERFPAWVYALTVAPDGSLYAGGKFNDAGGELARNVARWDGQVWYTLGAGVSGGDIFTTQVDAIAIDGTKVYVGGNFTNAGGVAANNIALWDGQAWRTLGAGLSSDLDDPSPVLSLLVKDGALYAGGTFTGAGGNAITALAHWDGAGWSAVGPALTYTGARVMVYTLAASKQGGIFAGGVIERAGGIDVFGITHWDGTRWESLGQGVALFGDIAAQINAVAVDAAGRVYVGGLINTVGGLHVNNIAMWDGERWHDVGGGVTSGSDGTIHALLTLGDDVYVGGIFMQAGGKSASRIARWNRASGQWSALGAGMDGTVYALAYGDGVLYAGGSFARASGEEALDVAAWDGQDWAALGGTYEIFEILDTGSEAGTFARALAYHNGELFIGGHFQTIHRRGANTQDKTSYLAVHNVVGYSVGAKEWFTIGQGGAMGVTTNGLSGISTTVYALAAVNGGLYIGGTFNRGGGLLTPNLARWDLSTGAWSSPGVPSGEGELNVMALASLGNTLVVAGSFSSINAAPARSVATYDTLNGAWGTLGDGIRWYTSAFARVTAAAISPDAIYLGGQFSHAGPHPSLGFAHYQGEFGAEPPPGDTYRIYLPGIRR